MENDNFKLEPYQNDPSQQIAELSRLAGNIFHHVYDTELEPLVRAMRDAVIRYRFTRDYDDCHQIIAAIEAAKWKAMELRSDSIFDIVQAEQMVWEIFADIPIPFVLAKDINLYGDIPPKAKPDETEPPVHVCECGENLTTRTEIERGTCVYCAYSLFDKGDE